MFKSIITASRRILVAINGDSFVVSPDHPNYAAVRAAVDSKNSAEVKKLLVTPSTNDIPSFTNGQLQIKDGNVVYGDVVLHTSLTNKIMECMQHNQPHEPLLRFLENLLQNPSTRAVNEAYDWIKHNSIKITDDGCWLGYKRLNTAGGLHEEGEPVDQQVYVDVHSGTIRQWVGKIVEVPRNTVDDNWGMECSEGLHVGTAEYAFSGNVRVLVKVNPRDMVTVPREDVQKCRVCKYQIIEIINDEVLPSQPLYTGQSPVTPLDSLPPKPVEEEDDDGDEEETDEVTYTVEVHLRGRSSDALLEELDLMNNYASSEETDYADDHTVVIYKDMLAHEADDFKSRIIDYAYVDYVEIIEDKEAKEEPEEHKERDCVTITFSGLTDERMRRKVYDAIDELNIESADIDTLIRIGDDEVLKVYVSGYSTASQLKNEVEDFRFVKRVDITLAD